jgi:hypothetical protein
MQVEKETENMATKIASEYLNFIKNPQGEGLWCLKVEFTEESISSLKKILNLDSYYWGDYRARYKTPIPMHIDEPYIIPLLMPRLFSYLRACLTEKSRKSLTPLFSQKDEPGRYRRHYNPLWRAYYLLNEVSTSPTRLSQDKIRRLKKASLIYQNHFAHFYFKPVPDDPNKLDFIDNQKSFFQVIEEIPGQLKIVAPSEAILQSAKQLFESIPSLDYTSKKYKLFSPETSLMQGYLPILRILQLDDIVRDKLFNKNLQSAIDEATERRYPHAIRAIGIASEEILVEIFETLIREKAPEAPIGALLSSLNERINKIVHGTKKTEVDISTSFKEFGTLITSIKTDGTAHPSVPLIIETIQKHVLPLINQIKKDVDANITEKRNILHLSIFPINIQNCMNDILNLRNRVSHRVDKRITIPDIGYIEAVIAIKSLLMLGMWWNMEKVKIDYKQDQKDIINDLIKRSSTQ